VNKSSSKLEFKISPIRGSTFKLPVRMTEGSVGFDLFSASQHRICILSGEVKLVPCGFSIEIPIGYEGQIRPRSGLALQNSMGVLNSPGTIDADYRGEVGVVMINHGIAPFNVFVGDRIAQIVFARVSFPELKVANVLSETAREGGFGSTGLKAA